MEVLFLLPTLLPLAPKGAECYFGIDINVVTILGVVITADRPLLSGMTIETDIKNAGRAEETWHPVSLRGIKNPAYILDRI